MYPQQALDEHFPPNLRSLLGCIESRTVLASAKFSQTLRRYSVFDLTTRLPELIRDDVNVVNYLLACIDEFWETGMIKIFPPSEHPRVTLELCELTKWLHRQRSAWVGRARM